MEIRQSQKCCHKRRQQKSHEIKRPPWFGIMVISPLSADLITGALAQPPCTAAVPGLTGCGAGLHIINSMITYCRSCQLWQEKQWSANSTGQWCHSASTQKIEDGRGLYSLRFDFTCIIIIIILLLWMSVITCGHLFFLEKERKDNLLALAGQQKNYSIIFIYREFNPSPTNISKETERGNRRCSCIQKWSEFINSQDSVEEHQGFPLYCIWLQSFLSCALKMSPVTIALLPLGWTLSCVPVWNRAQVRPFCHSISCVQLRSRPIRFNEYHILSIRQSPCGLCVCVCVCVCVCACVYVCV